MKKMEEYIKIYKENFEDYEKGKDEYRKIIKIIREEISVGKKSFDTHEELADFFLKQLNLDFSYAELKKHLEDNKDNRPPKGYCFFLNKYTLNTKEEDYLSASNLFQLSMKTFSRILGEDLSFITKKFPLMALEKSFLLKSFYNYLQKYDKDIDKDIFYTEKKVTSFFFCCLFGKDETPFNEEIPYLRMVQPPENLVKENGRFNASGQSRFYLTSHKFGAYFELRKYEKENRDKKIFIQKFKVKKAFEEERDKSKIVKLDKYIISQWEEIGTLNQEIFKALINHSLKDNYNISNYLADIVQSVNKGYLGVTYPSGIFNNDNEIIFADDVIKINKSYTNLTFFSDYWDKLLYLEQQKKKLETEKYEELKSNLEVFEENLKIIEYKLIEAKDYFTPLETELNEYKVEDVIIDFFEEMQKEIKVELFCTYKIDFRKLLENENKEVELYKIIELEDIESFNKKLITIEVNKPFLLIYLIDFFNKYFGIYYKVFMYIDKYKEEGKSFYLEDVKLKLVKIY